MCVFRGSFYILIYGYEMHGHPCNAHTFDGTTQQLQLSYNIIKQTKKIDKRRRIASHSAVLQAKVSCAMSYLNRRITKKKDAQARKGKTRN